MTSSRSQRMLRLALTPRWLLILLALLLFIAATVLLGRWQWDRTQTILDAERAAVAEPVSVLVALGDGEGGGAPAEVPAESIGRTVIVNGQYDPAMRAVITSRSLDGEPGVWIVHGIPQPGGSAVAVVRGWLPAADDPGAAVPSDPVEVRGVLHPDELFYADAPVSGDEAVSINSERLAAMWDAPVLPGFVVLKTQVPGEQPAPAPVPQTVQTADVPFPLQNFFYAFQWWVFAGFGIVLYARWLWVESAREDELVAAGSGGGAVD